MSVPTRPPSTTNPAVGGARSGETEGVEADVPASPGRSRAARAGMIVAFAAAMVLLLAFTGPTRTALSGPFESANNPSAALEAERLEAERLEAERLEAERLEAERLEAERLEAERLEAERLEAERLEAERLEAERLEAERLEAERLEAERVEAERLEAEHAAAHRAEAAREAERAAAAAAQARQQSAPSQYSPSGTSVWDSIAQCESNGNWSINSGNGFYGGVQFTLQSWQYVGGTEFAPMPHQASREQQIIAAERLLAKQGWGAWPACSRRLGLR
jgi:resuscitation-promoting factor RpfB